MCLLPFPADRSQHLVTLQLFWQTSILRLPRKRTTTLRDRIVHAKSPIPKESSSWPEALAGKDHREACLETNTTEIAAESAQHGQNEAASVEGVGAKTPRVHVRVSLEGLQDADREQKPTIWAVARGDNPSGEKVHRTINWCCGSKSKYKTPCACRNS